MASGSVALLNELLRDDWVLIPLVDASWAPAQVVVRGPWWWPA